MAYTVRELDQLIKDKIYASRLSTWEAQNDISYWRGLHHKKDEQLLEAAELYKKKIQKLLDLYKQSLEEMDELIQRVGISIVDFKSDTKALVEKMLRMAEKYWAVRYEMEGRAKGFFKREPIGTTYYIDLTNGDDTNDGLSTATAWKTLENYTSVTVRSPGDVAYIRAGTTEIKTNGNIAFDEDGNANNYISIIGCDSMNNDPWGDASDIKPIVDFSTSLYRFYIDGDDFWKIVRLQIKNGTNSAGICYMANSFGWLFDSCDFIDTNKNYCPYSGCGFIRYLNCEWKNSALFLNTVCHLIIQNCIFNNGAKNHAYAISAMTGGHVTGIITDSSFGQTTPYSSRDIMPNPLMKFYFRNIKWQATPIWSIYKEAYFYYEDANGVYGAGRAFIPGGELTKDSTIKTGNASFSIKMAPNAFCGPNLPLRLHELMEYDSAFKVYLTGGVQKTLTIKLYAENAWTTWPTADELYIEASYYSSATTADRTTVKSMQVLSAAATWTDFSVTLTPQRDGIVYLNVFLKKYEAGKTVHVNGEVTVS